MMLEKIMQAADVSTIEETIKFYEQGENNHDYAELMIQQLDRISLKSVSRKNLINIIAEQLDCIELAQYNKRQAALLVKGVMTYQ